MKCIRCGKELTQYDVGLHRKLINRGAKSCMCIACLAEYFCVSEQSLQEKIVAFQRAGCTLFPSLRD